MLQGKNSRGLRGFRGSDLVWCARKKLQRRFLSVLSNHLSLKTGLAVLTRKDLHPFQLLFRL